MINFNTEYFGNNCYFYIKDRGDKISLYYNVAETLTESRKSDEKIEFDKKDEKKVKGIVSSAMKTKSKVSKKGLEQKLKGIKSKKEIEEFVGEDGSLLGSRIPYLNQTLTPHKTMDQTIAMSRATNDPLTRGYRVYYGESKENSDEVINEVDYSEAFGYEETKDMDYNDTVETLDDMGVDNADERAEEFGKIPKAKKKNGRLRQRLAEKDTIEEQQKQMMRKMVEDILTKKSKDSSDVIKNTSVSKILKKNLQAIKNIAEKEGISINMLIKALKSSDE